MKKQLLAMICVCGVSAVVPAWAQAPSAGSAPAAAASTPPPVPAARGPSSALAEEAARVAIDACTKKGFQVAATVVDSAGIPKALLTAEGARARPVQSSTNKAVTAVRFGEATSALNERQKTDPALAAKLAADTTLNARPGAVLLKVGSEIVGAIGVGGASPSEVDEACAQAGLAAIQARLR